MWVQIENDLTPCIYGREVVDSMLGTTDPIQLMRFLGADSREISLGERKRNQPIQTIVRDLLKQLNLVHDMHVEDLDAIEDGYAVKITTRKSKQVVDLTESGRAVTQVLPILVQCFCAPRNPSLS